MPTKLIFLTVLTFLLTCFSFGFPIFFIHFLFLLRTISVYIWTIYTEINADCQYFTNKKEKRGILKAKNYGYSVKNYYLCKPSSTVSCLETALR